MGILRMLMALAMVVGGWRLYDWHQQQGKKEEQTIHAAQRAVDRLSQEIKYRAAMGKVELSIRGWPATLDPQWFKGNPPNNPFAAIGSAWAEVAPPEDCDLTDPPIRLVLDRSTPAFWYNPCKGIVRARVSPAVSDERALEIYNRINRTNLASLFEQTIPESLAIDDKTTASAATK